MVWTEMVYGFSTVHPRLCFAYFVILMCGCMLFRHPVYLLVALLAIVVLNISIDGGRALKKGLKGYLLIAFIIFITNPLFSSRGATILFYVFDRPVTMESMVYGALFALSLLNILFAFVAYNLIITPEKFLYLLSPIAPRSAFIITVTLRFVPLLTRRLKQIMTIQSVMGYLHPRGNKKHLMREGMETLHTLISWSLEEALETASSMRARGYGIGKRSSATSYKMERRDTMILWIMVITGANFAIGALYGVNEYTVYPRLQPLEWSPQIGLNLVCFLIFIWIPIVLNGKEWLHWRSIKSKM